MDALFWWNNRAQEQVAWAAAPGKGEDRALAAAHAFAKAWSSMGPDFTAEVYGDPLNQCTWASVGSKGGALGRTAFCWKRAPVALLDWHRRPPEEVKEEIIRVHADVISAWAAVRAASAGPGEVLSYEEHGIKSGLEREALAAEAKLNDLHIELVSSQPRPWYRPPA